jgi:response regulator NasT
VIAGAAVEPTTATRPTWAPKADHPGRILVADDESLAAASLILSLRQLGYTAIGPAHDGEHAIELAFSTLPDLALMDARMNTDSDGIDAARAMFGELLTPVVIVSAYSDREQVGVAAEAGVFGYLVKPVSKEQLRPAIEIAWARFNQYMSKEIEAEVLYRHLEDRRDVDRARWTLVERGCSDESEAMRELRRLSKASGRTLGEVARDVLGR